MPGLVFRERSWRRATSSRVLVLLLGCLAAGGPALATASGSTWRPTVVVYTLLLGCVRFLHFALFEEPLLSPLGYSIDAAIMIVLRLARLPLARTQQMTASTTGFMKDRASGGAARVTAEFTCAPRKAGDVS